MPAHCAQAMELAGRAERAGLPAAALGSGRRLQALRESCPQAAD